MFSALASTLQTDRSKGVNGQASKGTWWMPWRQEAMKGVASCDKPRGAASRLRSGDARMRKLTWGNTCVPAAEFIGGSERTRETETSKYPQEEKSTEIPQVVASERGSCLNRACVKAAVALHVRGCGAVPATPMSRGATKFVHSRIGWKAGP